MLLVTVNGWKFIDELKKNCTVLELTINSEVNCDIYNSCLKAPIVTQVSAMSTAIGFITFQVIYK